MPEQTVRLPDGNAALAKEEARHQQYQEQRYGGSRGLRMRRAERNLRRSLNRFQDDSLGQDA
jgi:hypothetical protein